MVTDHAERRSSSFPDTMARGNRLAVLLLNTKAPLRQRGDGYVTGSSTAGRGGRRDR